MRRTRRKSSQEKNRGERIRTSGLLVPNQALYQAKLRPGFFVRPGRWTRTPCVANRKVKHGVKPSILGFAVDRLKSFTEFFSMVTASIDITKLNTGQKLALMEELWVSMTTETESQGPPDWHESELQMRQDEWVNRESVSEDWTTVRDALARSSE